MQKRLKTKLEGPYFIKKYEQKDRAVNSQICYIRGLSLVLIMCSVVIQIKMKFAVGLY